MHPLKQILWYVLAGTRGGPTRILIIQALRKRPFNANQLAEKLKLDYKTVQHHLRVLIDNGVITANKAKYGAGYFLSEELERNIGFLDEILAQFGYDSG